MAEYVLETKDLGISFGGLKAAQNVNLKIKKNEIYAFNQQQLNSGINIDFLDIEKKNFKIFNLIKGIFKKNKF